MIRIAILDDEKADLEKEEQITRQYFYNRQAESEIATYQSVEWFLLGLTEEQFDIYILDAEMPVKNGIEVAKEIRKLYPEPVIIYVTNHLNYAVEAYEVNTYRYIAKDTMEKGLNAAYETLLPILLAKEERYYIVKKRSELEKIAYSDIFYVKKEGKEARKPLPIGISDYVRAQSEYYYVDKTGMIKEFLDRKPLISLFTRPRRFGKTLKTARRILVTLACK